MGYRLYLKLSKIHVLILLQWLIWWGNWLTIFKPIVVQHQGLLCSSTYRMYSRSLLQYLDTSVMHPRKVISQALTMTGSWLFVHIALQVDFKKLRSRACQYSLLYSWDLSSLKIVAIFKGYDQWCFDHTLDGGTGLAGFSSLILEAMALLNDMTNAELQGIHNHQQQ